MDKDINVEISGGDEKPAAVEAAETTAIEAAAEAVETAAEAVETAANIISENDDAETEDDREWLNSTLAEMRESVLSAILAATAAMEANLTAAVRETQLTLTALIERLPAAPVVTKEAPEAPSPSQLPSGEVDPPEAGTKEPALEVPRRKFRLM